jgi:CHASE3 domain sensor protein
MYIETGTFWVVAAILAIAIGAVYYNLYSKIRSLEKWITEIKNESHRTHAEIYGGLADISSEIEKKPKK